MRFFTAGPHGQDARATGVAPIDPLGPANSSYRKMTIALSRYSFCETSLIRIIALFTYELPALRAQCINLEPVTDRLPPVLLADAFADRR